MTQSKANRAKVQADTAIRLDRPELEKAGVILETQDGSTTHVSPMAGKSALLGSSCSWLRVNKLFAQMCSSKQSRWTRASGPSTSTCRPQHP